MVSSSVFDELLGIPYPACIFLKFGWVGGGVNIGAASGERFGKTTPDRCHLYNPTQYYDTVSWSLNINSHVNMVNRYQCNLLSCT